MIRNGLTDRTSSLLTIGLLQSIQVQRYIERTSATDPHFLTSLRSGFVHEYKKHHEAGVRGDELFDEMQHFSSQGHQEMRYQSAGLAVLVYLFERCEVFER